VLIEVVDLDDPLEVGSQITYEIRVTNQGSATLTNLRLTCAVPEEQEFVSGSGSTAVEAQDRAVTTAPLPTLNAKATASWRVLTKALKAGDSRFSVKMSADQFQHPVEEIESTTLY
jgi:uncharacterized repeat protein (TIGR01451 family)